jgi:hypothetical protein
MAEPAVSPQAHLKAKVSLPKAGFEGALSDQAEQQATRRGARRRLRHFAATLAEASRPQAAVLVMSTPSDEPPLADQYGRGGVFPVCGWAEASEIRSV